MDGTVPNGARRLGAGLALLALAGLGSAVYADTGTGAAPLTESTTPAAPPAGFVPFALPMEPPAEAPAEPAATPLGTGIASYYGARFHGRRTASGEAFDMHALTAAHPSLPFGSLVRVTNPANGREVVVRINDRGPHARGRAIDLSKAAAEQLGLVARGHGEVAMEVLES